MARSKLSRKERRMCWEYAKFVHPAEYEKLYTHVCTVSNKYQSTDPRAWIETMVELTSRIWEANNPDIPASKMIEDILHDAAVRHQNFN